MTLLADLPPLVVDETAGDHLEKAVRTGSFCCYDPRIPTSWQL